MRLMNPASRRLRKAARREAGNKTRDMTINPEWQNKPLFVTVKQAAGMLGVSHKTVYRLLERRLLKASGPTSIKRTEKRVFYVSCF